MGDAPVPGADLRREVLVSCVINAVMSAVMFLLVFGAGAEAIATAGPGGYALDFLPQSLVLSFLSAVVPALAWRAKRRRTASADVPPIGALLRRAVGLALLGAVAGLLVAGLVLLGAASTVPWATAFGLKLAWGVGLGAVVTVLALRPLLR